MAVETDETVIGQQWWSGEAWPVLQQHKQDVCTDLYKKKTKQKEDARMWLHGGSAGDISIDDLRQQQEIISMHVCDE